MRGLGGLLGGLAVALGQIQEKNLIGDGAAPAPAAAAPEPAVETTTPDQED